MKNKVMQEMKKYLALRWGEEKAGKIMQTAQIRLQELCRDNASDSKAVKTHTEQNIFPAISLYEALQKHGIAKEEALAFLDECWSERAKPGAESVKKMLHFAGLYKLYPAIFRMVAKKSYGTASGFAAKFYDCGRQHCKFDMTKCIFNDTCRRYGYPELTQCFCHVDDINNSGLHPRLCWNRTQFMGGGADFCDFDIFVTPEK